MTWFLTVSAVSVGKGEGTTDPQLGYTIAAPGLVVGDSLSGSLTRQAGETPGQYAIRQGTLTAGANYDLRFVEGVLTITPAATPSGPAIPAPAREQAIVPLVRVITLPSANNAPGAAKVEVDATLLCPTAEEGCTTTLQ